MTEKNPVLPIRPAPRPRAASAACDLESTRIARVDPQTGDEVFFPALSRAAPAADPDATVIGTVPTAAHPGRPVTAEVVPPRDARLSSEVTAAWAEDASRGSGRFVRCLLERHRRLTVVSAGAVAIIAFAASVLALSRDASPTTGDPEATGSAPTRFERSAASDRGIAPPPRPPELPAGPPAADPEVLAERAACALADGRLGEARGMYASLAAADPANRAWSLAVEILDGSGAAR